MEKKDIDALKGIAEKSDNKNLKLSVKSKIDALENNKEILK